MKIAPVARMSPDAVSRIEESECFVPTEESDEEAEIGKPTPAPPRAPTPGANPEVACNVATPVR